MHNYVTFEKGIFPIFIDKWTPQVYEQVYKLLSSLPN